MQKLKSQEESDPRTAHFTFRTEVKEGRHPIKKRKVKETFECLYIKLPGRAWKMVRAFKENKRPSIEEVEALLMGIAESENLRFLAVPGIPEKIGLPTGTSLEIEIEAPEGTAKSLIESYALELVMPKEFWEASYVKPLEGIRHLVFLRFDPPQ